MPQLEDDNPPLGAETGSEHLMPYLMKYVLENRIGVLPYSVEKDIKHHGILG
jgi:hypothetical protein